MAQRLSFFLHRQPHLSRGQFQARWHETYARLVAERTGTSIDMSRSPNWLGTEHVIVGDGA